MKRSLVLSLALIVVLFSSLSLAPVPQVNAGQPQDLSITIDLKQDAVDNVQRGESDRWRTTVEEFTGAVTASNLGGIPVNSLVSMSNFTNFEFVPGAIPGTFDIDGTAHSTMIITTDTGATITIKGDGTIKGNIPFGATIKMNVNSTGSTGSLASNHVNGKLNADFTWFTRPPSGTATLTGTYQ